MKFSIRHRMKRGAMYRLYVDDAIHSEHYTKREAIAMIAVIKKREKDENN